MGFAFSPLRSGLLVLGGVPRGCPLSRADLDERTGDWVWWDPQAMALAGKPHPGLPTLLWVAARPGVQSPPGVTRLPLAASCFLPMDMPPLARQSSAAEIAQQPVLMASRAPAASKPERAPTALARPRWGPSCGQRGPLLSLPRVARRAPGRARTHDDFGSVCGYQVLPLACLGRIIS